jgi:hypothetical protein
MGTVTAATPTKIGILFPFTINAPVNRAFMKTQVFALV